MTQKMDSDESAKFLLTLLRAHGNNADAIGHFTGNYTFSRRIEDHIGLLASANGCTVRRYNGKCHISITRGQVDSTEVEERDIVAWIKSM